MDQGGGLTTAMRYDPWDVVVLGAGPAGAIAARQLALHAHRVLLIEKLPLPRFKVCGGCLGGAALDALEQIGLGDLPAGCNGLPLRRMELTSGGVVANFAIGRRIALSRQDFDDALVAVAAEAGATVCEKTLGLLQPPTDVHVRLITLRRGGQEITVRARAVLMATGLSSCRAHAATRIWSKSRLGLGALLRPAQSPIEPDTLHMACSASGYVGVAPVEGGGIHVAAAVDPRALAAARSPGKLIGRILKEAGLPISGVESADWRGTPLLTRQTRPLGGRRCLLIGDAAGYVEPFTGEGIGWAMQSAVLASSLLEEGLEKWPAGIVQRWQTLYAGAFSRRQGRCYAISRLLRSRVIRQLALWGLRRAPYLAQPLVRRLDRPIFSSTLSR